MFYPTLDITEVAPLDVLAVGAHPGDAELFCGGTLLTLALEGRRTGILDLSTGDMSPRGLPQQRVAEADAAAKVLQVAWRGNLGLPDGRIENNILARMTLAGIVRGLRPKLVLGPHPERRHPDHRYTWELLRDACYAAGWPKLDDELAPHRPSLLLRGAPDTPAAPSLVVPITREQVERKIEALQTYRSQFEPAPGAREGFDDPLEFATEEQLRSRVLGFAATYGFSTGIEFGEPFYADGPVVGTLLLPSLR
jgi:bacillithiol biosynthesis deacetylase BshB1